MLVRECSNLVSSKISPSRVTTANYFSTDNILPNLGGYQEASSLPATAITEVRPNDILLSNIRPYFKKMVFSKVSGGCSTDVICLRVTSKNILPAFLFYALSSDSFFNYYVSNCKGTKMPRGDKTSLLNYSIPDYPLQTQQHIVGVTSSPQ